MNVKRILAFLSIAFAIALVIWLLRQPKQATAIIKVETNSIAEQVHSVGQTKSNIAAEIKASVTNNQNNDSNSIKSFSQPTGIDIQAEWKHAINFWGRVIDESNNAVIGASVHFVWNDLSENGTSEADTTSDGNGGFLLTGRQGKRLYISVSKDGYYGAAQNFEYANPYQGLFTPDQDNPVVFNLRKKNGDTSVISKNTEFTIGIGKPISLSLDEQTTLQIDLLTNAPMSARQWAARVSIVNGGIQLTLDEFPFEAPLNDYQTDVVLTHDTLKPPTWGGTLFQGGQFYIKTATGYGRMELRMISGKSFMRVTTFLNPTGSRNLEAK